MPGADRDTETGRFTDRYPPDAFVEAVRETDDVAGTQDVAERVGVGYDTAYKKLRRLEAEDRIRSRKVGNARVWLPGDE